MASPRPSARALAHALIADTLRRRRPFDEALAVRLDASPLEPRDRAFARLLAATVLRNRGRIDALIAAAVPRALPPSAAAAEDCLRLGLAQMLFLDTPAHAAVSETVDLAAAVAPKLKGLVNAVLRRMSREGYGLAAAQDAARINTPDWLWHSWVEAHGEVAARDIAEANAHEATLDISVARDAERWASTLHAMILPTGTLRRAAGGAVTALPGFAEGAWWIQDAAAALPARLLGDVKGKRVLDLCAAPGGKTAQLAAAGAAVTAVEKSPERAKRLAENLARLRLEAEIVVADAADYAGAPADAVLLDAPCSATGTIRRHPDIPWLKRPEDIPPLCAAQDRLLDAAARLTAPGGRLVYAVCSLQAEEGPDRIAAFLRRRGDWRRAPIAPDEFPGLDEFVGPKGELRTLPGHWPVIGGMDGFYAARLRRGAP